MVTAPLLTVGVAVDLPNAQAKALNQQDNKPLEITLDAKGSIFIGETPVTVSKLQSTLSAIASQASQRLQALMFGAEDLAGDIGAIRSRANWEVFYARSAVVTAAAAYGLEALDMILTDFNDVDRLEEEATFARQMGYRGKMLIHPRQVEVVNRVFAPSAAEIAHARRLVTAHIANQAAGAGAFALDGKMVDMPLVRAAEHILEKARLAGLLEDNL
jgi:citrate lyase beta subunit